MSAPDTPKLSILTRRQIDCLRLAAEGLSSLEIAEVLRISPRTVDQRITDARDRLNVRNRVQAVVQAVRMEMI
jgi:DNA-binding CsgD family transcriptional regulator